MADSIIQKPLGNKATNITFNSNIKASEINRYIRYGNVVQVTGNITFSDSFPIDWNDTTISTNVPITDYLQYCGIVRFDEISVPPAIVVATSQGLKINPRNINIQGKQGLLIATYIAKN